MKRTGIALLALVATACSSGGLLEVEDGDWRFQLSPVDDQCAASGSISVANGRLNQPSPQGLGATVPLPIDVQPVCLMDGTDFWCPEHQWFAVHYDGDARMRMLSETRGTFSRDGSTLQATLEMVGTCFDSEGFDVFCPATLGERVIESPCTSTFSLTGYGPSGREDLPAAGTHGSCSTDAAAISTFTDQTPTVTTLTNATNTVLSVFWIDTTGVPVHLDEIYEDAFMDVNGFVGYVYEIRRRDDDSCVRIHTVEGYTEGVTIGGDG